MRGSSSEPEVADPPDAADLAEGGVLSPAECGCFMADFGGADGVEAEEAVGFEGVSSSIRALPLVLSCQYILYPTISNPLL